MRLSAIGLWLGRCRLGIRRIIGGIGMVLGRVGLILAAIGTQVMVQGEPILNHKLYSSVVLMAPITTLITP